MAEAIDVSKTEYIIMELGELHRMAKAELQEVMDPTDMSNMIEAMRLMVIVMMLGAIMQAMDKMG